MAALRRATLVVAVLGLVTGLLDGAQIALPLAYDDTLPSVGTVVGVTRTGSFLASPLLVAATGYWIGGRVALAEQYVGLVVRFALAGAAAVFVGYLLVFTIPGTPDVWRFPLAAGVQSLFAFVEVPLYGLAGGALAHFG
jgi:hypothetical protein